MLMEPIILVFIKLMGATISGHWDLRDTGTTRDYDTLARSLGWLSGSGPGWGHAWLPKWLRPVTAKRANNQGANVHISNSTTLIVLISVSGGQLRDCWTHHLTPQQQPGSYHGLVC